MTFLPGVFMVATNCFSTPTTQTTPAAAMKNVSAHGLVHQARTKIKVVNPLAKHVPVDNTKNKVVNPLANHVAVIPTKTKREKVSAKNVPMAPTKTKREKVSALTLSRVARMWPPPTTTLMLS